MKSKFIILLAASLLQAIGSIAQQKFTLKGSITSVPASSYAFLAYTDGQKSVRDSAMLSGGMFSFQGTISHPVRANLWLLPAKRVKNKLKVGDVMPAIDGTDLMLDPTDIKVEGATIASAKISAGQSQADYILFKTLIDTESKKADQIWEAEMKSIPKDSVAQVSKKMLSEKWVNFDRAIKGFVISHPDSQVSQDYLTENSIAISDPKDFEEMLSKMSSAYQSSYTGKVVAQRLAAAKKFAIGQPAINFSQKNDKGEEVSLAQVNKGKYVLIDFWASWCGPCRTEYPYLKKAYNQYKDRNFEIIGVSLDDNKANWLEAIKSNGFQWIELCDLRGRQNEVASAYGIAAIPQSFLIDPEGNIIAKNLRGDDLLEKLKEVIK
jgi:peroxiredoxin